MRPLVIVGKPRGIGIPHNIQPMTAPLLSITGICQEPVDHLGKRFRVRRPVIQKCSHLFRCGRKTDQIESGPANQSSAIGLFTRFQTDVVKFLVNEGIHRVRLSGLGWHFRIHDRLVGPEIFLVVPAVGPVVVQPATCLNDHPFCIFLGNDRLVFL